MARLDQTLDKKGKDEIAEVSGGLSISQMVNKMLDGIDTDKQVAKTKEKFQTDKPTKEQIEQVSKEMVTEACKIFDSAKLRQTILDVKKRNEIVIDSQSIDKLIDAGFDEEAKEASMKTIKNFEEFMEKNKDKLVTLQILY